MMFESFKISGTGMTANRLWLDTISNNIANMNSTGIPGDAQAAPYKRQIPIFSQLLNRELNSNQTIFGKKPAGVTVTRIIQDNNEPRLVYDPSHPHAADNGYVAYPNINITNEIANMMVATRAYEANATVLQATKEINMAALQIARS